MIVVIASKTSEIPTAGEVDSSINNERRQEEEEGFESHHDFGFDC